MKILLKIVTVLLVLIIAALFILPIVFKDKIIEIAKDETNKAVNAEVEFGDISLSLIKSFPDFFLSIEDIKVSGTGDFKEVSLAEVGELDLVIDLMSVINGENIQLKRVGILNSNIHLKVLEDGRANWDIAIEDSTVVEEVEEESTEETSNFKMDLQEISIQNFNMVYEDLSMPMVYAMHGFNSTISGDLSATQTNLNINTSIEDVDFSFDGSWYLLDAIVKLDAGLAMDLENMKFEFLDNTLRVNELPLAFNGWLAMPEESIDMDLTYAASETAFREFLSMIPAEFSKELEGVETSGTLALEGYVKGSYTETSYPAFAVNMEVANGMFKYPDLPKSVEAINIKANIESADGDLDHTVVDVSDFSFNMAGNPFSLNLYLTEPISDPFIRSSMNGKIIIDNVKDVIPLEEGDELAGTIDAKLDLEGRMSTLEKEDYESFKANGRVELTKFHYATDSLDYPVHIEHAKMEFSPAYADLSDLNMKLGKSDIQANGRLENFIGYALSDHAVLHGKLELSSQLMDINELAGIDPEAEEVAEEVDSVPAEEVPMEVVVLPRNIDFTTTANIQKLIYDDLEIKNIKGGIVLKDQKLSLQNTNMEMLDGGLNLTGYYETSDSLRPTYDFAIKVSGFDVQKTTEKFVTIEKLAPIAKYSKGNYSSAFSINGALDKGMNPIYESMNGGGKLKTQEVKVEGFKPMQQIAKTIKYDQLDPLELNDVNVSFSISGGKVFVEPFDIKVGNSKVTVSGWNSFDQSIHYTFDFEIPREEFGGQANSAIDGLLSQASAKGVDVSVADNISIAVKMVGTVDDPKITTDFSSSANNAKKAIEEQAKEMIEEQKKELERQAKAEAEKKKKELEEQAKKELEKQKKDAQKKLEKEAKKKLKGLFGK